MNRPRDGEKRMKVVCVMRKVWVFLALSVVLSPHELYGFDVREGFSEVVKETLPAVVSVRVEKEVEVAGGGGGLPFGGRVFPEGHPLFELFDKFEWPQGNQQPRQRKGVADGSGFVVRSEGIVVTNNHVVEGADSIRVTTQEGESYDAEVVGSDPQTDLALLRLEGVEGRMPVLVFGDSDEAEVGDWTLAIGNPLGHLGGSVTAGIISARNRDIRSGIYDDYIQTDTSINQGNSGGPLLNADGEVIGVNTIIFSSGGGGSIGLSFSIPSNLAKLVVAQLLETGSTQRGWLGVEIEDVSEDVSEALDYGGRQGALIARVLPDSPAERGGMKDYDILLRFDGKEVPNGRRLPLIVGLSEVDSLVSVVVWREGRERELRVRLGERGTSEARYREESEEKEVRGAKEEGVGGGLGFRLGEITDDLRRRLGVSRDVVGAIILEVSRGGEAESKGLVVGDIIVEVDRRVVQDVEGVLRGLREVESRGSGVVLLKVRRRNGRNDVVGLRLKQ